jgi:catechol 2,3-dioxygenase-like lactoylglutathione lyase family enzyme
VFEANEVFASYSVDDVAAAREFYGGKLGFGITDNQVGFDILLASGGHVLLYGKDDHRPASFTVLNILVTDIDAAVDALVAAGVTMERYEGFGQDERGISRDFGSVAWFRDPAGNVIALLGGPPPAG